MSTNKTNQQPPPDVLYGSLRMARQSILVLGRAVGIVDPDKEENKAEQSNEVAAPNLTENERPKQPPRTFHQSIMAFGQTVGLIDSDDEEDDVGEEETKQENIMSTTKTNQAQQQQQQQPRDLPSGSIWRRSITIAAQTIGLIDSDDEEDETKDENEGEKNNEAKEEKKEERKVELPEDKLSLPDATTHRRIMLAKKARLKEKRQLWMVAGATGGAVVGGLILFPVFPIGMLLGGGAGASATKVVHKHREKKKLKKLDRKLMLHSNQTLKIQDHRLI